MNMSLQDLAGDFGSDPPTPMLSDWIELAYLIVLFTIGAPLNTAAFARLNEQHPNRRNVRRLETLKKHVNYSDLLIIFLYIPSRVCWTLTYQWRGGIFLCKLVKFGHTLAFQSNSNVIVCVSVDRVFSILSPSVIHSKRAERRVRILLTVAWILAFIGSIPQLVFFTVFSLGDDWEQCSSIWDVERYLNIVSTMEMSYKLHIDSGGTARFNISTSSSLFAVNRVEYTYIILHQISVFLLPAVIIASCYTYVAVWLISVSDQMETRSTVKSTTGTTSLPFFRISESRASSRLHFMRKRFSDAALSLLNWKRKSPSVINIAQSMLRVSTVPAFLHSRSRFKTKNLRWSSEEFTTEEEQFVTCGDGESQTSLYYTTAPEDITTSSKTNLRRQTSSSEPLISIAEEDYNNKLFDTGEDVNTRVAFSFDSYYNRRHSDHMILRNGTSLSKIECFQMEDPKRHSSFLTHNNVCKIKRNSIRVSGLLVFAYIICWLPYNILTFCSLLYPHLKHEYKRSFYILKDFIALNAVLNPFLYGMFGHLKRCTRINA